MDTAVNFPTTPKAVKAVSLKLTKRMSVEQAFQAIVRSCIEQVRANERGVSRFHDTESLHQMRVGLRRLRTSLAMFDDVLPVPVEIETELLWLMDQLAPARDWAVLLASTLAQVEAALPDAPSLAPLRIAAHEKLDLLNAQAANATGSLRCQKLLGKLEHWLDERSWRDQLSVKGKTRLKMRVIDFAGAIVEKEQQRLLKRGARLKGANDNERHRVRIAAKRARYAAEFFASLYPGKLVRPYVAALSALQRELGAIGDGAVARSLLDELCADNAELREAAALVSGYIAASAEHGLPKVRTCWKKLAPLDLPH